MRLIIVFFILFSPPVFSIDWDSLTLQPLFEGCLQNSDDSTDYEYCGCYVNGISKNFEVLEVVELNQAGKLETNNTFLSIVEDCVYKSL